MNEQPMSSNNESMSVRETLKGVGIRAGILTVGGLVAGGWLTAFALKTAGKIIHLMLGLVLLLIGAGAATWEVKKIQRRFSEAA